MKKTFPYDCDLCDFDNGLRLITAPVPFPHVVSLQIVVHAGSRNEVEDGCSGFAHFFEHMMFRGTPAYPPDRYEAVLQNVGASSNAYTDDDHTVYHSTLTRADLPALLAMEADRFRNLDYPEADFRTEALAVLGEYNKDSAEPLNRLTEVLRDTAFDRHTYKHTTMGFLRDIERMPEMYNYSREFFRRFYRPEYTTIVLAGDLTPAEAREWVSRDWAAWPRGTYRVDIPSEPPQDAPRHRHISWQTPTLPYLTVAFKSPAYDDSSLHWAALDLIAFLGFSEVSPVFERLVIEQQWCDLLWASNSDHVDPYLFTALARIKEPGRLPEVQEAILNTFASFTTATVPEERLEAAKSRLRYGYMLSQNSAESVAATLAHYVSLKRSPETINRLYATYDNVTPQVLMDAARRYFVENGRTIVTLAEGDSGGSR